MTYVNAIQIPTEEDIKQAKQSSRTLSKYANVDRVHLTIQTDNHKTIHTTHPFDSKSKP